MLALPLCEMSDNDFNQTLDTQYMRCQYDADAVNSINRAGTQPEARQQEATRILSAPHRVPRRVPDVNIPEPVRQEARPEDIRMERLLAQQRQIQLLQRANDIILQHIMRLSQTQVAPSKPKMSVILKLDAPTEGVASCGICMSDEIPIANMVTTACNHEYCDTCISQIVSKNPCCAFCRGKIAELCVNSHDVYNKLHSN
jgi:hypothetical protein